MREDWIKTTIDSSCIINYGTRVVRSRDGGSIYDVYGGGGATFKMDSYNREDCMVIARFAMSPQCTRFVSGKFYLNDSGLTLSAKDTTALSQAFLDKVILAYNDKIYACGRGSAQKNLRVDEFKELAFGYPKSLSEQQRIVDFLDAEFEKIDQLKANADAQLQAAKDLFQAALKERLEHLAGYETLKFGEVFPIQMGKTPPRADVSMWDKNKETNNLWVSVADITRNEGNKIESTAEHISDKALPQMRLVPKGSLLMSFKLTIGKMAIAGKDLYTNEAIIAIPINDKYDLRFIYYYLSAYPWETLTAGAEKVMGKTLNKSSIGQIILPVISHPEQKQIASQLDAISEKVQQLQQNYDKTITLCNDLKQAFLKSIFE